MDQQGDSITIEVERYNELLEAEAFLQCLQGAGVDNWEGYEIAVEVLNG